MSLNRDNLNKELNSYEHQSPVNVNLPGLPVEFNKFTFQPGGTELTFGEIITLAGDYFGVEEEPIAFGDTEEERRSRFLNAYAMLANCPNEKVSTPTTMLDIEEEAAKNAIAEGINTPDDIDKDIAERIDTADSIDKVTPEATKAALESTDAHLTLALHKLDHFNKFARIAYETGYALAMDTAVEAAQLEEIEAQQEKLKQAYTLYAFGCHFMTDLFATGHVRMPTPMDAVQLGINEIYHAFETKEVKPVHQSGVNELIQNHPPILTVAVAKAEAETEEQAQAEEDEQKKYIDEIYIESLENHSIFSRSELRKRGVPSEVKLNDLSESSESDVSFELAEVEDTSICPIRCNIL